MKIKVFDILPETGKKLSLKGTEPFLLEVLTNLTAGDPEAANGLPRAPQISAELDLTRDGKTVFITGGAHATIHPPCARCLIAVETNLDPAFELALLPAPVIVAAADKKDSKRTPDRELLADEIDEFTYTNDEIDVGALINEQVLLEKPYKILCSEDCKGLCPSCGANLNEAPCQCKAAPKSLAFLPLADMKLKD